MIDSLTLKNFQCHSNRKIKFEKNVNTIVGSSDTGKSAIIRALKWGVFNRPSGNAFCTHGTDLTEVSIQTNDNTIIRRKSKSLNEYEVNGDEFKAIKKDIPEVAQQALSLGIINFQDQHDAPFMLSETAGEVGKRLNQIVNLDIIDSTISFLNKRKRGHLSEIKFVENRIDAIRKDLEKYDSVPDMIKELDQVTEDKKKLEDICEKKENLNSVYDSLNKIKEYWRKIPDTSTMSNTLDIIKKDGKKLEKTKEKLEKLKKCYISLTNKQKQQIIVLYTTCMEKLLEQATSQANRQKTCKEQVNAIESLVDDVITAQTKIKRNDNEIQDILDERKELEEKLKKEGVIKRCPTCNQIIQS